MCWQTYWIRWPSRWMAGSSNRESPARRKLRVAVASTLCRHHQLRPRRAPSGARRAGLQDHGARRYRRIGNREAIVAVHSVKHFGGVGGLRWTVRTTRPQVTLCAAGHVRARRPSAGWPPRLVASQKSHRYLRGRRTSPQRSRREARERSRPVSVAARDRAREAKYAQTNTMRWRTTRRLRSIRATTARSGRRRYVKKGAAIYSRASGLPAAGV